MNQHDQYFAAQRINLAPRATGVPLARGRRRSPLRALALGIAIGAALAFAADHACAAPPPHYGAKTCQVEAVTARQIAEARDSGIAEALWHERLDAVAASHPELALTDGDIRREHAAVREIWALGHLAPDTVFAFVLHRCLFGRVAS